MTIPYLFWDYDDKKQAMVMEVLKAREEATGGNLDGTTDGVDEQLKAEPAVESETESGVTV